MQYVRSISGSVSKTWNSINPATLSGAIDVVVVEQQDGSLACSPFHVRFGKFSLLRPSEKKVEFKVNNVKQDYSMKLGEGGEAFFVFETSAHIPKGLQTSPVISPAASPASYSQERIPEEHSLQEPEPLDLSANDSRKRPRPSSAFLEAQTMSIPGASARAHDDLGRITPASGSPSENDVNPMSSWSLSSDATKPAIARSNSDELLTSLTAEEKSMILERGSRSTNYMLESVSGQGQRVMAQPRFRSTSPPPVTTQEAVNRAIALSKKLSSSNIRSEVTDSGDLMLDMEGYKSSEEEALRAELVARRVLAEELQGNYDIGALIGADERGNLWIYSSEEAKEAAARKNLPLLRADDILDDAASDPGHSSDEERSTSSVAPSSLAQPNPSHCLDIGLVTPPKTPPDVPDMANSPTRSYAKTLRLTSDQLKGLNLKPGANAMSFSVNRAACQAYMYYWTYDVPVVISDIDGTITKSDALGHVLNMIGRDWTHLGVAKLFKDIVANGYNIMYLTSRSVGQADTTRTYLDGINQEGHRLPKGPVILSPDRTIAALRREIYLRKPEVFKMACLRDISTLFGKDRNPFYAGFGNRITDALSYRSVKIPQNRIFTINPNAEVSIDILTLNKYKSSYVSMRELVDHFFPPVGLLLQSGGEGYTDFSYWRSAPLDIEDFSDSDSEEEQSNLRLRGSRRSASEDEGSDADDEDARLDALSDSYLSRDSIDQGGDLVDSILESIEDGELLRRESVQQDDGQTPLAPNEAEEDPLKDVASRAQKRMQ